MDIRIPNLGEGADSGSIVNIFVKEGDRVTKDQTLVELENEKAVAPIPSTQDGVVRKIHVKVGDKVTVGQAILSLSEEGKPAAAFTPKAASAKQAPLQQAKPAEAAAPQGEANYSYVSKSGLPPPASPTVRGVARDLGIDLTRIQGSEAGGRIVLSDLKAHLERLKQLASAPKAPPAAAKAVSEKTDFSKWGPVHRKALSSLRQTIGGKMTESWTTIPHVTQFDEADITELMALRKKYQAAYEKKGAKLTLTPFVMKAVVAALKKFPDFNSSLDEETRELVLKDYYHLGVAVDTEAGLIVPVVRDADKKNLLEIAKDLETLADRTRQRKISIEELKGSTFTISNLGSIGGTFFTPIVNKPEVAVLGVGRGVWRPVVIKSKAKETVEARWMLPLGLSYDHRVIDGADGARFIRVLVDTLENFDAEDVNPALSERADLGKGRAG